MSLRLRALSFWMPRFLMVYEVERIKSRTYAAMDCLLARLGIKIPEAGVDGSGTLEERRAAMARGHEVRARALVEVLGEEEAVRVAREALFRTGLELGEEARERLEVGDSRKDLIRAAGVMYRVLGIEFSVADTPEGGVMEVRRCALAKEYSHLACLMLSAVDEGVVSGLNPNARMLFREHITGGRTKCVAAITIKEEA